jgi:hypothetical protein
VLERVADDTQVKCGVQFDDVLLRKINFLPSLSTASSKDSCAHSAM